LTPRRVAATLAGLGAATLAAGIGLIYLPAGVIAAGIESIAGAYVIAYLGRGR
jgi:hypothetical protein